MSRLLGVRDSVDIGAWIEQLKEEVEQSVEQEFKRTLLNARQSSPARKERPTIHVESHDDISLESALQSEEALRQRLKQYTRQSSPPKQQEPATSPGPQRLRDARTGIALSPQRSTKSRSATTMAQENERVRTQLELENLKRQERDRAHEMEYLQREAEIQAEKERLKQQIEEERKLQRAQELALRKQFEEQERRKREEEERQRRIREEQRRLLQAEKEARERERKKEQLREGFEYLMLRRRMRTVKEAFRLWRRKVLEPEQRAKKARATLDWRKLQRAFRAWELFLQIRAEEKEKERAAAQLLKEQQNERLAGTKSRCLPSTAY